MTTKHFGSVVIALFVLLLAPQAGGFASSARGRQPFVAQSGPSNYCPRVVPPQGFPAPHAPTDSCVARQRFQLAASSNGSNDRDRTPQHNSHNNNQKGSRLGAWRRRWRRFMVSLAIGTSLFRAAPPPANARYSHELGQTPISSLRPGTTLEQVQQIEEGALDGRSIQSEAATLASPEPSKPAAKPKKQSKQSSYYDDFDDDDDDDFLEEDVIGSGPSKADQATAKGLQSRSNFASYHQGKSRSLTIKVGLAFFVPTYGALIIREQFRRRKEANYVQKGLEILEAQKAEYFNITGTAADSDVQDALKDLKKNETSTDDDDDDDDDDDGDDDDDDDDDDEDDTPRGRKGGPRRPPGGGDDDGGSSGGSSDGSGRPSEEDLDKLNSMFKRS